MKRGNQLDGIDLIFSFFFFPPLDIFFIPRRERGRGEGEFLKINSVRFFFFFLNCSYNSGRSMFPWNISRGGGTKV